MVLSSAHKLNVEGPIFLLLLLMNFASADSFTGVGQPLQAPISECSVPPAEIREDTLIVQVKSQFRYWVCNEYRASKTKTVYYRIEAITDGEYIHLIPTAGKTAIDLMDYRLAVARVYQSCVRIRQLVYSHAEPLHSSKCSAP